MNFRTKYAVREMKARPGIFIPFFLTILSVMVLMFNILIYMESCRVTDIEYYRLDFDVVLEQVSFEELEKIQGLPYVKNIHCTENSGTDYTVYIRLNASTVYEIYSLADKLMKDVDMWSNPNYANLVSYYRQRGISEIHIFNSSYMDALSTDYTAYFQYILFILLAAACVGAASVLVFGMKIQKCAPEYAVLRSMGMKKSHIGKINMSQSVVLTVIAFPFAVIVSALSTKLVCVLSHNLYPEFKDNTALLFKIPYNAIFTAGIVFALTAAFSVYFMCYHQSQKNIVSLLSKLSAYRIPFVEKTSPVFESADNFDVYFKLYSCRTKKDSFRFNSLFSLLIIFPIFFASVSISAFLSVTDRMTDDIPAFTVMENGLKKETIPQFLLDSLAEIEGVSEIKVQPVSADSYYLASGEIYTYSEIFENAADSSMTETGGLYASADDSLRLNEVLIPRHSLFTVGDTVLYKYNDIEAELLSVGYSEDEKYYASPYTVAEIFDLPEPIYNHITLYAADGMEETVVQKAQSLFPGSENVTNEYEKQFTSKYLYENTYIATLKHAAADLFTAVFIGAQVLFLLIFISMIIASNNTFRISLQKNEFAIMRSLGYEKSRIVQNEIGLALKDTLIISAMTGVLAYILFLFADNNRLIFGFAVTVWRNLPLLGIAFAVSFILCAVVLTASSKSAVLHCTDRSLIEALRSDE